LEPFVCRDGHPDCCVSDADMALISAAPDMLAEIEQCAVDLKEAADILRPTWPAVASLLDAVEKRTKAAASKATGVTP
jgi:uncharacterized NAD(P)/FAD-binding protein YdhS